jgi:hypothetical protein
VLDRRPPLLSLDGVSLKMKEAKELNPPPPQQNRAELLGFQKCVFGCLGDAEFDHGLGHSLLTESAAEKNIESNRMHQSHPARVAH